MDINNKEFLEWITSITPSQRQLNWQAMGYYNFIHYGLNTYIHAEWGTGKTPASKFNPSNLDTDQWAKAMADSGSKGVIITAKHHDGFCLYPSKYTDYSVAGSPYKNGKGDVVGELSKSCKKYGLKFGIYLSPWDRNAKTYGSDAYNDFYCNQLEELLTNYGELFAVWFDGACGEGPNGRKQVYDWNRYYDLIRKLQPNAVIAISGPDVRWIGNEGGHCRASEWSVQSSQMCDYNEIKSQFQQDSNSDFMKKEMDATQNNLGARETLLDAKGLIWYPAEMDVSITKRGWFYHKSTELFKLRSLDNLMELYNTSVGGNATLLLNIPVNKEGLFPNRFVKRLKEFGEEIKKTYGNALKADYKECGIVDGYYEYCLGTNLQPVKVLEINEDITKSQRIESFEVYAMLNGAYTKVYDGTTVGYKKFCNFINPIITDTFKVRITSTRNTPMLLPIKAY